jgi:phage-related tail protein
MANTTTPNRSKEELRTNPTLDKAREAGAQALDRAKETASSVGEMVSQAASTVGKTADNLTSGAGTQLKNLGDTISAHTPQEGMLGSASQAVAGTIKQGGQYLEESGLSGVAEDVTNLIRRNPVPAVLIGVGIGFLLGRALRR